MGNYTREKDQIKLGFDQGFLTGFLVGFFVGFFVGVGVFFFFFGFLVGVGFLVGAFVVSEVSSVSEVSVIAVVVSSGAVVAAVVASVVASVVAAVGFEYVVVAELVGLTISAKSILGLEPFLSQSTATPNTNMIPIAPTMPMTVFLVNENTGKDGFDLWDKGSL